MVIQIKPVIYYTDNADSGLESYHDFVVSIEEKFSKPDKHYNTVLDILEYLALHGPSSTWQISQSCFKKHNDNLGEIMVRRILEGRNDRGKTSLGIVGLGLVVRDLIAKRGNTTRIYGLTVYGMLYCIKKCEFTRKEFFEIAEHNKEMFPKIFGKINYLKSNKVSLKPLEIIAQGEYTKLEELGSMHIKLPYLEMLRFLKMEYPIKGITLSNFVNFVALWFYTYLMLDIVIEKERSFQSWLKIIHNEPKIKSWYFFYTQRVLQFYVRRNEIIEKLLEKIAN